MTLGVAWLVVVLVSSGLGFASGTLSASEWVVEFDLTAVNRPAIASNDAPDRNQGENKIQLIVPEKQVLEIRQQHLPEDDWPWIRFTTPSGQKGMVAGENVFPAEPVETQGGLVVFEFPAEQLLLVDGRDKTTHRHLNDLPLMDYKNSLHPQTGLRRSGEYSLWENGLFMVPILSALLFQAMPDYHHSSFSAPLIHSTVTGLGGAYLYLTRDQPFWKRVAESSDAEGWLEVVLPLMTMGYGVYEFLDSVKNRSIPFGLHSSGLIFFTGLFASVGKIHLLSDVLVLELSSIFLSLKDMDVLFRYGFAASFLLIRLGIFAPAYVNYLRALWNGESKHDSFTNKAVAAGGLLFNGLNVYWSALILRKIYLQFTRGGQ